MMEESTRLAIETLLKQHATTYDSLARDYHAARFGQPAGRYDLRETAALIKDLVDTLQLGSQSTWYALDVACGTGKVAVPLAQLGAKVTALDAAPAMLEQCAARAREAGVGDNLTVVEASAERLPFDDNTFDAVFSFRFLHLFPAAMYPDLLREMTRVTKPGGYLVVETKNLWHGGALYWLKGAVQRFRGHGEPTTAISVGSLAALSRSLAGVKLHAILGLLFPKGWWLGEYGRPAHVGRMLARGSLKGISAHLVAVYRKE
jgi:ubiquinone/menaquinone biosynthesis C-methylase UbiE